MPCIRHYSSRFFYCDLPILFRSFFLRMFFQESFYLFVFLSNIFILHCGSSRNDDLFNTYNQDGFVWPSSFDSTESIFPLSSPTTSTSSFDNVFMPSNPRLSLLFNPYCAQSFKPQTHSFGNSLIPFNPPLLSLMASNLGSYHHHHHHPHHLFGNFRGLTRPPIHQYNFIQPLINPSILFDDYPTMPQPSTQVNHYKQKDSPTKIAIGQKLSDSIYANSDSLRYDLSSINEHRSVRPTKAKLSSFYGHALSSSTNGDRNNGADLSLMKPKSTMKANYQYQYQYHSAKIPKHSMKV